MTDPDGEAPRLSLVVLAWDKLELTRACVASLRATTDASYELVVVDNGSAPAAAAWVRDAADVAVLHDTNRGFAPGMNSGLAAARGDVVVFINNDTVFPDGWASSLLSVFDDHPDAGIVLPAVTASGNPSSVRAAPGDEVVEITPFHELPSGVVYAMRRDFVQRLGGWDERYEVASREDLDLLFATWANGRRVLLDERVLVEHVSNATASTKLADRDEIWMRNWHVFVAKWTGPDAAAAHPQATPELLVAASAAAHWLDRWYALFNERAQLRSELKQAVAERDRARTEVERARRRADTPPPGVIARVRRRLRRRRRS